MCDTSRLNKDLISLGFIPSQDQIDQFVRFYTLLVERNKYINLTAITEWNEVVIKHFIDSVAPFGKVLSSSCEGINDMIKQDTHILDIGAGAGFPSIPLKIMFPKADFLLVDALGKRVDFLNEVISELGLTGIVAMHGRAEELAHDDVLREKFDIVVSRAVSHMSVLSEYCIPFVKVGGNFVAYKGEKTDDELRESQNAIMTLGGGSPEYINYALPNSDIYRSTIVISKAISTPDKYPRRAGIPEKRPL